LSAKPKILVVSDGQATPEQFLELLRDQFDVVEVQSSIRALSRLARETFAGVYVTSQHLTDTVQSANCCKTSKSCRACRTASCCSTPTTRSSGAMAPQGMDRPRKRSWSANFYSMLGSPEILGPDFCPFHTALATGRPSSSTLRSSENRYFQVHAAPVFEAGQPAQHLIVTVRDVTGEMLQQQKLAAIHQAGVELADLTPDELSHMTVEERIELLKSNILHFTKDLLNFDVVEIRLLDAKTGKLEPLLSVGLTAEAANRDLYAQPQNNGVTGFVAATGKSYLCEDTTADPLYLEGCRGAKSSLTVPLVLHDEVIGTFNVESPTPGIHRKRFAVPRDLHPRRSRRAQHAGTAAGRKGLDRGRKRRSHP